MEAQPENPRRLTGRQLVLLWGIAALVIVQVWLSTNPFVEKLP